MLTFLPGVISLITRHEMLSQTNGVVIACSGGADSTCLLHHLVPLCRSRDLGVLVGHLNHGLRGAESDRDEAFVRSLAASYDVPCTIGRARLADAMPTGQSPQARYRAVRLAFLRDVADTAGFDRIALGHTLDDVLETFFIRFLRGSGLAGLRGMLPVSDRTIRPLLEVSRDDIVMFLQHHQLPWVEDSSNAGDAYLRNKVRHRLIPLIKQEFDGDIHRIFSRTITSLRADDDCIMSMVAHLHHDEQLIRREHRRTGPRIIIDKKAFSNLHEAMKRRLLIDCLHEIRRGQHEFPSLSSRVEDILEAVREQRPASTRRGIDCGDCVRVIVTGRTILIGVTRPPAPSSLLETEIVIPGTTHWLEAGVLLNASILTGLELASIDSRSLPAHVALFDLDLLGLPLTVRARKAGDRFIPFGHQRARSLKRFLTACGVDSRAKNDVPLVLSGDTIIWVCGYRRAACAPITPATKTALRLTFGMTSDNL